MVRPEAGAWFGASAADAYGPATLRGDMVSDHAIGGKRLFPGLPVSILARTRAALSAVKPGGVGFGLLLLFLFAAGLGILGLGYIHDARLLARQQTLERRVEQSNLVLSQKLALLEDKLGETSRKRAEAERRLAAVSGQSGLLRGLLYAAEARLDTLDQAQNALSNETGAIRQELVLSRRAASSKQSRIAVLTRTLGAKEKQLRAAEAERTTLSARLAHLQAAAAEEKGRENSYRASLARWARQLKQAISERDQLKARLSLLQGKQSRAGLLGRQGKRAALAPSRLRLAAQGSGAFGEIKRALASTGLDVERIFAGFGTVRAEGGPFVPPPKGGKLPGQLDARQLRVLRRVAKALPLSLPLNHYELTSGFGPRRDPLNGREEFHDGLDLAAPYMTPIYSTAAGTVVYAGWKSGYGKLVEIDHGYGVSTLYAHMHRYTVLTGEHVAAHTQIGYIGTTGDSTGPHVHYQVMVNGHPQNPMKFVSLGRLFPVAAR